MSLWKERIVAHIKVLCNEDLMLQLLEAAGGDDYDGCFTTPGQFEFDELQKELFRRLRQIGFLPEEKA